MVGGIRSMRTPVAAAALGLLNGPALPGPQRSRPAYPERERERQSQRWHEKRARERKQRRQAEDEMRERLLRERIAKGQDDRADKYLHASARRRREAERAARPLISE